MNRINIRLHDIPAMVLYIDKGNVFYIQQETKMIFNDDSHWNHDDDDDVDDYNPIYCSNKLYKTFSIIPIRVLSRVTSKNILVVAKNNANFNIETQTY